MTKKINKTQTFIDAGDVQLSIYEWRKSASNLHTIVFIHGYPDDASVWNQLAEQLALTHHVVSYDVRGTGLSSAPISSKGYAFEYLIADLDHVIKHVSPNKKVHLVGHDWGALQGWEAVFDQNIQHKIQSYTALAPSLDHVGAWFHQRMRSLQPSQQLIAVKQLLSSSYMAFFNLPFIPELSWKTALAKRWPSVLSILEKVDIETPPHQLRNGINGLELYRKNLFNNLLFPKSRITSVPVHLLSMTQDPFVPQHMLIGLEKSINAQFQRTDIEAGHWGILSQPQLIAEPMANFIQQFKSAKVA